MRGLLDAAKAGHAGTLDPLASGILPIALGEATKTVSWAVDGEKEYRFTVRWGEARETDDLEGAVTATSPVRPDEAAIRAVLPRFIGRITQRPPRFSAIKVDGERAYALAREEVDFELATREVEVDSLDLVEMPDADHAVFETRCGKGTYVRSLARDLGEALGTFGHVSQLRRTRVGPFDEDRAIPLDLLETLVHSAPPQDYLLPIETALDGIPAVSVSETQASLLRHGQPVRMHAMGRRFVAADDVEDGDIVIAMAESRLFSATLLHGSSAWMKPKAGPCSTVFLASPHAR